MLVRQWPDQQNVPALDITDVREATKAADAERLMRAIIGRESDEALQEVGTGMVMALEQGNDDAEAVALSVVNRLIFRAAPGDQELAEELLPHLRGNPFSMECGG